jgi:hypothetical protein
MTTWTHTSSDSDTSNPKWVNSFSNVANSYSLDFDNSDDYVNFGDVAIFEFTYDDNYTVSAWVNSSSFTDGSMIASKAQSSGDYRGWYFFIGTDAKVDFSLYNDGDPDQRWKILSSSTLSADTWYHVLATHTYADSTHTGTIYINGDEGHSTSYNTLTTQDTQATTRNFNIGARNGNNGMFNGKIDEVAVWDVALSAADALLLYNDGTPSDLTQSASYDTDRTDDLIGYWRFTEGTGTSIADSSTNSNTGTITSGEEDEWVVDVPGVAYVSTGWNTLKGGVWNLGSLVDWEDLDRSNWEDWN